jgi:hypothetical protein
MSGRTHELDRDTDAHETTHSAAEKPSWRARASWILMALSLAPGLLAAASREWWHGLPAGVRLSAYILSGVLIVAACGLIMVGIDRRPTGSSDPTSRETRP